MRNGSDSIKSQNKISRSARVYFSVISYSITLGMSLGIIKYSQRNKRAVCRRVETCTKEAVFQVFPVLRHLATTCLLPSRLTRKHLLCFVSPKTGRAWALVIMLLETLPYPAPNNIKSLITLTCAFSKKIYIIYVQTCLTLTKMRKFSIIFFVIKMLLMIILLNYI